MYMHDWSRWALVQVKVCPLVAPIQYPNARGHLNCVEVNWHLKLNTFFQKLRVKIKKRGNFILALMCWWGRRFILFAWDNCGHCLGNLYALCFVSMTNYWRKQRATLMLMTKLAWVPRNRQHHATAWLEQLAIGDVIITLYPIKYTYRCVVLCFVIVILSVLSTFVPHILQGCAIAVDPEEHCWPRVRNIWCFKQLTLW